MKNPEAIDQVKNLKDILLYGSGYKYAAYDDEIRNAKTIKQLKKIMEKANVKKVKNNPAPESYTRLTKSVDINSLSLYNNDVKEMKDLHDRFHQYPATKAEVIEIDLKQGKDGKYAVTQIGTMPEFKYISDKYPKKDGSREKVCYVHGFKRHLPIYTNGKVLIIPLLDQEITERGFIYKKS